MITQGMKWIRRLAVISLVAAAFTVILPAGGSAYAGTRLKLEDDEAYSGAGMTWDGSTLVLSGCNFRGQIKLPKNSTVVVSGVNNIVMDQAFEESGALIGSGALTINGGGTLNVTNACITRDNCYAIVGKKELTIDHVTINASAAAAGEADISAGISARKAIKITNSVIAASGCEGARTSAGIRGNKSIFIGNSTINAAGGSFGIVSSGDAVGISYSNVSASGGKAGIKAKDAMQFVGVAGGVPGEDSDRWYVMSGGSRVTDVKLTVAQ